MATERQIEANQNNALRSTGPATARGYEEGVAAGRLESGRRIWLRFRGTPAGPAGAKHVRF